MDEDEAYRARAQLSNAIGKFFELGFSRADIMSEVEAELDNREDEH